MKKTFATCDRCGETKEAIHCMGKPEGWVSIPAISFSGATGLDSAWDVVDLCGDCSGSLAKWWGSK